MTYEEFLRATLPMLGYNWHRFRSPRVRRRIARVMQGCGAGSWESFSRQSDDPGVQRSLQSALTVTISRFWRNAAVFSFLQHTVFPEILGSLAPGEPLIAWSAGTASCQEAYSLAMAVASVPEELVRGRPIRIVGSDIDVGALRRGLAQRWTKSELREIPRDLRYRFLLDASEATLLNPSVRRHVILVCASLWDRPPLRGAHLVLCRNCIMTYLHGPAREEAMERLVGLLPPGGWLVLGRKEHLPKRWAARWKLIHTGRQIYRKAAEA